MLDSNEKLFFNNFKCNNIIFVNRLKREGVAELISSSFSFFHSDSYFLCIVCKRYNIYNPCTNTNNLLCFSCLVDKKFFESSQKSSSCISEMQIGLDLDSSCINQNSFVCCSLHENLLYLGLHCVFAHGDILRKHFIIKQFIYLEFKKLFNSFIVFDHFLLNRISWQIIDHGLECLYSSSNRKYSLREFYCCFEFYHGNILNSAFSKAPRFYSYHYEVINRFFDGKDDFSSVSSNESHSSMVPEIKVYELQWHHRWVRQIRLLKLRMQQEGSPRSCKIC